MSTALRSAAATTVAVALSSSTPDKCEQVGRFWSKVRSGRPQGTEGTFYAILTGQAGAFPRLSAGYAVLGGKVLGGAWGPEEARKEGE